MFSLVYSDSDGIYPLDLAIKRLEDDLKTGLDYSFVAIEEDKIIGGIICKKNWGETGWELCVDTVQVYPEFQKAGVGKQLMAAAVNKAKENGASGVGFPVDSSNPFPGIWYEKMGFKKTKWIYYWGECKCL